MTEEGPPAEPGRFKRFYRYAKADGDHPSKESRAWRAFKAARWIASLVVVILAARAAGHDVCNVTTTTRTGLPSLSWLPRTESSRACRPAGLSDLVAYAVIIAVLLIPDARSLSIGSLKFERLSSTVEQVAEDVGTLVNQSVSQTVTVGESLLEQNRNGFLSEKAHLDVIRGFLPQDMETRSQLEYLDDLAQRAASATWQELTYSIYISQLLLNKVRTASEAAVLTTGTVGDTDEGRAHSEAADDVLPEFITDQDEGTATEEADKATERTLGE